MGLCLLGIVLRFAIILIMNLFGVGVFFYSKNLLLFICFLEAQQPDHWGNLQITSFTVSRYMFEPSPSCAPTNTHSGSPRAATTLFLFPEQKRNICIYFFLQEIAGDKVASSCFTSPDQLVERHVWEESLLPELSTYSTPRHTAS